MPLSSTRQTSGLAADARYGGVAIAFHWVMVVLVVVVGVLGLLHEGPGRSAGMMPASATRSADASHAQCEGAAAR